MNVADWAETVSRCASNVVIEHCQGDWVAAASHVAAVAPPVRPEAASGICVRSRLVWSPGGWRDSIDRFRLELADCGGDRSLLRRIR